jgi:PPE-repeat protein
MLAAAAAWEGVADELRSTASTYQSVISELTGEEWLGPTSASMAAAVAPYMTWMRVTGAQAEQTATNAVAAAGAFEAAFAMTVPPAGVAANRAQLAVLVASNAIGQNAPAIAATEAQYGEMWAQDAAAMYGYAASSASAAVLKPFSQPAQVTSLTGPADQAAAVLQSSGTAAASSTQATLAEVTSALPAALQSLASPLSSLSNGASSLPTPSGVITNILNFFSGADGNPLSSFLNSNFFNGLSSAGYVNPAIIWPAVTSGMSNINELQPGASAIPGAGSELPALASVHGPASMPGLGGVSAAPARSVLVGRLSVPQSWTAATQVANHAGVALPGGGWTGTVLPESSSGVPGMPGIPAVSTAAHHYGSGPRYGFRPTVMARPPAAG